MNKRGTSHADWAISLGIFLLYILSMLMIIQPGVEPFYREDQLLKIATDNFKENTAYSFYKTPLIINTAGKDFTPGAVSFRVTLNAAFPFSGFPNDYAVTDANLVPLENFYIADGWGVVRFNAPITAGLENKFYIITNKLADGISDQYLDRGTINEGEPEILKDTNFTLTIGSTEATYGVSEALLGKDVTAGGIMCSDGADYEGIPDGLKAVWNFPQSKDFITYYIIGSSPQYTSEYFHGVCNQTAPYAQANVFVEEWATRMFKATDDPATGGRYGKSTSIRMGVKVW